MNHQEWDGLEPARSRMRVLVARVDAELGSLQASHRDSARSSETDALAQTWRELVAELALGPEPELRSCPHCQRRVLRQATRCRYCMRQSAPAGASQ